MADRLRASLVLVLGGLVVVVALIRAVKAYRGGEPLAAIVIVGCAGLVFSPVSWTHHQVWLALAALLAVSTRRARNVAWSVTVAVVMVAPVTSIGGHLPGEELFGNARLLLAAAIACAVPFRALIKPRQENRSPSTAEPGNQSSGHASPLASDSGAPDGPPRRAIPAAGRAM